MAERKRSSAATAADVAHRAGVGKSTALRVLGGYGSASDEVRARVLAAAEELRYRPNELARSMNTGRSHTIGVVVSDIENPYFSAAMRGIADAAERRQYGVILANTNEELRKEREAVRVFLDKRVDALIVSPTTAYESGHLEDVRAAGTPLVLLDRTVPGLDAASVRVDIAPAAREATTTLLGLGHRRIAYVSSLDTDGEGFQGFPLGVSSVADRLSGILDAYESEGLPMDRGLIRFQVGDLPRARAVLEDLFSHPAPPTAILASDSTIARNVMVVLRERHIRIPDDVSLITFDDFAWAPLTEPPLTVIAQPIYDIGHAAAETALSLVEGCRVAPARITAKVIYRQSHGPVRAADA